MDRILEWQFVLLISMVIGKGPVIIYGGGGIEEKCFSREKFCSPNH
jgi:hypothetical protein